MSDDWVARRVDMKPILIVDDSPTVRYQVRLVLQQAEFAVLEACDGLHALQILRQRNVSLIVCDVNMPRMNGFELLARLRHPGATAALHVPVLMLTVERDPELIQRARKLGARGWISKPFNAELMLAAVRKLVG